MGNGIRVPSGLTLIASTLPDARMADDGEDVMIVSSKAEKMKGDNYIITHGPLGWRLNRVALHDGHDEFPNLWTVEESLEKFEVWRIVKFTLPGSRSENSRQLLGAWRFGPSCRLTWGESDYGVWPDAPYYFTALRERWTWSEHLRRTIELLLTEMQMPELFASFDAFEGKRYLGVAAKHVEQLRVAYHQLLGLKRARQMVSESF